MRQPYYFPSHPVFDRRPFDLLFETSTGRLSIEFIQAIFMPLIGFRSRQEQ